MYSVQFLDSAFVEIEDSYIWYEERQIGLGEEFTAELDQYVLLIRKNPFQFNTNYTKKLHFATLKKFPFRIVYRIYQDRNMVVVNSVFHTSRDPKRFF